MSCTTGLASSVTPDSTTVPAGTASAEAGDDAQIEEELLIEEISIDGMCGVY